MDILNSLHKWHTYQSERFPVIKYSIIVAAFSGSGLALSVMTTAPGTTFPFKVFPVAFLVTLAFFFQLRVSDEIKDHKSDLIHYPNRPVPRGLISLQELKLAALLIAVMQIALVLILGPAHLLPLFACWTYLYLMHHEFFASKWLSCHPLIYTFLHMLVLLCVDVFITSCHWLSNHLVPSPTLLTFYATSFFLGLVLEIGRKVKSPVEDFNGSNSYTNILGINTAVTVFYIAVLACSFFAFLTVFQSSDLLTFVSFIFPSFAMCFLTGVFFLAHKDKKSASRLETASSLFVLCTYLAIGLVPFLIQNMGS